jgi:pyrroline-5-carboxylate reductase
MTGVAFIGGGRVARILVGGWQRASALPSPVVAHEPDDAAFQALAAVAPGVRRASIEEAAAGPIVFLALHPPAMAAAFPAVRAALAPDTVLVSLAPKVTLAALSAGAGTSRVARVIPNAPSILGQGYNPVAFGAGLDAAARASVSGLLAPLGEAPEVDEAHLEAYAILSGMGPTYFWFQWQTLREIAAGMGLPRPAADAALRSTIAGALAVLLDSGLTPEAVIDLVPVKPLAAAESAIAAAYWEALPALYAKIRPAPPQG